VKGESVGSVRIFITGNVAFWLSIRGWIFILLLDQVRQKAQYKFTLREQHTHRHNDAKKPRSFQELLERHSTWNIEPMGESARARLKIYNTLTTTSLRLPPMIIWWSVRKISWSKMSFQKYCCFSCIFIENEVGTRKENFEIIAIFQARDIWKLNWNG
jgi:hypothetical protein